MTEPRVCFLAAPLIARSGVYNSTIELVSAARSIGLDWSAVIGVSAQAAGSPRIAEQVTELTLEPSGFRGVRALQRRLAGRPEVMAADLLISMVPQTDMALAAQSKRWVAYLRGLPWPARGESSAIKSFGWQVVERAALTRADEVWATTRILADEVGRAIDHIVPPGIVPPTAAGNLSSTRSKLFVWAARYSVDKNPQLFIDAMRGSGLKGAMYGSGPLLEHIREAAPENVDVPGWAPRDRVWDDARVYVGTSSREAFGRSAVEAAMIGLPVILSSHFGCADALYTDPNLADRFVLRIDEVGRWRAAMHALAFDDDLYAEVSAHVLKNAMKLTAEAAVANVRNAAKRVVSQ